MVMALFPIAGYGILIGVKSSYGGARSRLTSSAPVTDIQTSSPLLRVFSDFNRSIRRSRAERHLAQRQLCWAMETVIILHHVQSCPMLTPDRSSTAIGFQQSMANTSGILSGQLYTSNNAPRYLTGNLVTIIFVCVSEVAYVVQWLALRHANQVRADLSST